MVSCVLEWGACFESVSTTNNLSPHAITMRYKTVTHTIV